MRHINKTKLRTIITTKAGFERSKKIFKNRIIKTVTVGSFMLILVICASKSASKYAEVFTEPAILYMEDIAPDSLHSREFSKLEEQLINAAKFTIDSEDVIEAAEFK